MSDYLPADVLKKVFLHLPAKSLVRFTAVCKSWYSLITSSDFISEQSTFVRGIRMRKNPTLLLRTYSALDAKEHYRLLSDDEELDKIDDLEFPFRTMSGLYFRILDCVHGICLLLDDLFSFTTTMVLWNPAVKRYVRVPEPIISRGNVDSGYIDSLGYGFDSVNDDYKIVRLVYKQWDGFSLIVKPPEVELYSLRGKCWKRIAPPDLQKQCLAQIGCYQLFTMGAIHWIAGGYPSQVLCFDVHPEVFRVIKLPDNVAKGDPETTGILDFNGSLAIYKYKFPKSDITLDVWAMKEYAVVSSWTKHCTVDLYNGIGKGIPLGFRKDGKMFFSIREQNDVFSAMKCAVLLTYEPKSKEKREFRFPGLGSSLCILGYVESIALLDKEHNAVSYHEGNVYGKRKRCTVDSEDPNFVDEIDGHTRGSFDEIWAAYALDPYGVFEDLS